MKKIFVLICCFFVTTTVFALGSSESNDVPAEYEISDTWYDGIPIITGSDGTEYYLASETTAYRIYDGRQNDKKGNQYQYCYDAESDVYIPMYGKDGDLEKALKRKTTEERIPYELDHTLIIPAGVDSIAPEKIFFDNISASEENEKYAEIDNALYDKTTKTLIYVSNSLRGSFEIPEGITGIGPYAINLSNQFNNGKKIFIPSTVVHIDLDAFRHCNGMDIEFESINPNADFCLVDNILYDKDYTTIIYIVPWKSSYFKGSSMNLPDTLESIPEDFADKVGGLSSITIPAKVKHIGDRAFAGDHFETELTFAKKTWIDHSYKRITISGDLPSTLETIGISAFKYADFEDGTITIPSSISRISNTAFQGIIGVETLDIPSTVKEIGAGAFKESSIVNITIAEGVESIEKNAFANMAKLESINIPASVKSIGENIFEECSNVEIEIDESCPVYDKIKEEYGDHIDEDIDWL